MSSVSTIFSPIKVPTISASFHGIPIVHAKGLNSSPSISCIEVPNKPSTKLIIATIEIKAINIAATFAASLRPSVAPLPTASTILLSFDFKLILLELMVFSDLVSG